MPRHPEEVRNDIVFLYRNDIKIKECYAKLYREVFAKGLIYYEIARSKFYGTIRYLIVKDPARPQEIRVIDLDTNEEYIL